MNNNQNISGTQWNSNVNKISIDQENKKINFGEFVIPTTTNSTNESVITQKTNDNVVQEESKLWASEQMKKTTVSFDEMTPTQEDMQIDDRTARWEIIPFIQNVDIAWLVQQIFNDAVASRTSDIHIEPYENFLSIRFRIDGEFYEYRNFSKEYSKLILTRVQVLAWLKIDQLRVPQDGKINAWIIQWKRIDMRVSTLPTIYWNKIVIRILEKDNTIKTLADLWYTHKDIQLIRKSLDRPFWMILMSWPTGSWKSTTLFAMLSKYDPFKKNISTLEDPVEYYIEWANQCQVNPEIWFDFADWLRSLVRQDPDIIMVWEIRDNVTAKLATQAAITGHLVFSTVHANTASTTVQRLINMWADPFLIADALNVVIAQRLIRKVCPYCKKAYEPTKKQLEIIKPIFDKLDEKSKTNAIFVKWEWCNNCHWLWFLWRVAIYEILEVTPEIKQVIIEKEWIWQEIEKVAVKNWLITMRENWIIKAMQGETTLEEALLVTDSGS